MGQREVSRHTRRFHGGLAWLAIAGVLVSVRGAAAQGARLTVRPATMATGTVNPKAGEYALDSVSEGIVSVPPQCVGAKRCPLFVQLPGGGQSAQHMMDWLRPVGDKYGLMVLTLAEPYTSDLMDAALKEALRRFAVDPAKIGVVGRCASGGTAMQFGIDNLDVFSRIASISGDVPVDGIDPKNTTAEFLLDRAFRETESGVFDAVQQLRREGHPVKQRMGLRGHEDQIEDYEFLGRWLAESWSKPAAARTPPAVVADPLPELTSEVLTKMTAFWQSYMHDTDSLWTEVRQANLREVAVPVGTEQPLVVMTDMAAIAAKFPSVAAALQKAGLTAQQHDAYRVALIGAMVLQQSESSFNIDPKSTMAKNLAYLNGHADEFEKLELSGVDDPSRVPGEMVWRDTPSVIKTFGPMGIWRSP